MSTNSKIELKTISLKRVAYYRMIANLHVAQGLILESEREQYIEELCATDSSSSAISRLIDGLLDSRIGLLLTGNLMGVSNKIHTMMAIGDEREAKLADIELSLLDSIAQRSRNR